MSKRCVVLLGLYGVVALRTRTSGEVFLRPVMSGG